MKLKTGELKIFYEGEINAHLDEELRKVLGAFGYETWASGVDLIDNVRDLAFELCGEKLIDHEGDPVFRMSPENGN